MRAIHKYPLRPVDRQEIVLPVGFEILTVQLQNSAFHSELQLWALVNPNETRMSSAIFAIYGTGEQIDLDPSAIGIYISTVQDKQGFVWHVFQQA